jgi:hypothetical protein
MAKKRRHPVTSPNLFVILDRIKKLRSKEKKIINEALKEDKKTQRRKGGR